MMHSRRGPKALALCALLIGLMSIGAGAAQAETGAYWLVNGSKISESLLPTLGATAENSHLILLMKLSNKGIHLLCTKIELEETHAVEPNGGLLGRATLTGCKFLELLAGGGTKEVAACSAEGGIVKTNKVKGLITLHEGQGRLTLTPSTGTSFMNIVLGEECAFGENITIGGTIVLKECNNAFLVDQVSHLYEEDKVLSKLWANSTANPTTLDGSVNLFLTGVHTGFTFAGHPA